LHRLLELLRQMIVDVQRELGPITPGVAGIDRLVKVSPHRRGVVQFEAGDSVGQTHLSLAFARFIRSSSSTRIALSEAGERASFKGVRGAIVLVATDAGVRLTEIGFLGTVTACLKFCIAKSFLPPTPFFPARLRERL
jgi:hypothetical protein